MKKKVIKKEKTPQIQYEYFFVRNSKYEDALKEADQLKEEGWYLRKWHYEATTLSFVLTMERIKKEEPKQEETPTEEEAKPWRRNIKKTDK